MRKTVVAFNRVPADLLEPYEREFEIVRLEGDGEELNRQLERHLPSAHGLIGGNKKFSRSQIESAAKLEIISSISVGYDNYDVEALTEQGVLLTNTPDVLTETTADLAFALILSTARRIPELDHWTKTGNWNQATGESQFGTDVYGKTLGILGMGQIGSAIARRGHFGFGMRILYSGRSRKPELESMLDARYVSKEELLESSDFVCPMTPLTDETRSFIGTKEFKLMRRSAILINVSRGPVVDEIALVKALTAGEIRAAGLDVFVKEPMTVSPLFALSNVVTVPHIGSATHETRRAMAVRAIENLFCGLRGDRPRDLINTEVWEYRYARKS
ncbi:D-glycerate dehydrogenase [Ectopseudomonas oleovorans]|uniref:Gluconate 2-dehydrogenase n=1 Tax=Ectopseudomonas oleovorans TaxID=301 RepID=A0A3D9E7Q5_ECTOL|nr:D-glycerate dehydrogenase [Pseudomonas oleovorans]REC98995.1 gluconate 2-dehydrogenase [Pseudomonas oleovorans]